MNDESAPRQENRNSHRVWPPSIASMPEWLRRLNEWMALFLAVIGVVSVMAGTEWLVATRSWVYANAPDAVAALVRNVGWAIHTVIEPYQRGTRWLFGLLPIEVPDDVAYILPPFLIVMGNLLPAAVHTHLSIWRRRTRRRIDRQETERYFEAARVAEKLKAHDVPSSDVKEFNKQATDRLRSALLGLGSISTKAQKNDEEAWKLLQRATILGIVFFAVLLTDALYVAFGSK